MKLAIADPPYLGRADRWYGKGLSHSQGRAIPNPKHGRGGTTQVRTYDKHPDAAVWDDPVQHRLLVERLLADYDGWVIAMAHDNLRHYYEWVPKDTRTAIWHKTQNLPSKARVWNVWEPVLVYIPKGRRSSEGAPRQIPDLHRSGRVNGFIGAKPPAWTRWVLDMLGYDPDTDTVDDLFVGSGGVTAEIAQGTLL